MIKYVICWSTVLNTLEGEGLRKNYFSKKYFKGNFPFVRYRNIQDTVLLHLFSDLSCRDHINSKSYSKISPKKISSCLKVILGKNVNRGRFLGNP